MKVERCKQSLLSERGAEDVFSRLKHRVLSAESCKLTSSLIALLYGKLGLEDGCSDRDLAIDDEGQRPR